MLVAAKTEYYSRHCNNITSVKTLLSSSVIPTHSCNTRCITKYCLRNILVDRFYHWIEKILKPPAKGKHFVLHRANKIRDLTSTEICNHIPGKYNPADCATRGKYHYQLKDSKHWLSGPTSIYESSDPFVTESSSISNILVEFLHSEISCLLNQLDNDVDILIRFSSFTELIRVVAWIQRFANNT